MARYTDAKCRLCRREGEKLFLKGERCGTQKCALIKRNYPPGAHGAKAYQSISEYGKQLREKQRAKRTYGLQETQFHNYYLKASQKEGATTDNLIKALESRLDNVVYRLGLAVSRSQARQLVGHYHFLVNGQRVNIPSYQVKPEDVIQVNPTKGDKNYFEQLKKGIADHESPVWLALDHEKLEGKAIGSPDKDTVEHSIDLQLIVEFYSR